MERRKGKSVPMTAGNDPALWSYRSVHETIAANIGLIAQLLRVSEQAIQLENKVDS
jgi:hypothetical protein